MSERMTSIELPGQFVDLVGGLAVHGRETVEQMIVQLRASAARQLAAVQAVLDAPDDAFRVETYRGPFAQRDREVLQEGYKFEPPATTERMTIKTVRGFDPKDPIGFDRIKSILEEQGSGAGWVLESFDPVKSELTVARDASVDRPAAEPTELRIVRDTVEGAALYAEGPQDREAAQRRVDRLNAKHGDGSFRVVEAPRRLTRDEASLRLHELARRLGPDADLGSRRGYGYWVLLDVLSQIVLDAGLGDQADMDQVNQIGIRIANAARFGAAPWTVTAAPGHDPLRTFAQRMVPEADLGLSRGEGALGLALAVLATDTINEVYADCGDSDAGVLGGNVGSAIAHALARALKPASAPTGADRG